MNETPKKSILYIWAIIGTIWAIVGTIYFLGMPFSTNWQLNKMDRKLTCIYNSVQVLAVLQSPELRNDPSILETQRKYLESSCDLNYISTGILTK